MLPNIKSKLLICIISFLIEYNFAIPNYHGCELDETYNPIPDGDGGTAFFGEPTPRVQIVNHLAIKIALNRNLRKLVESNLYDSMGDFLRFYNYASQYKSATEFIQKFMEYEPEYHENSSAYGLAMKVLKSFEFYLSGYKLAAYIITVHAAVHGEDLYIVRNTNYLPETFLHSHTAVVLKYRHKGINGYLLFEPTLGVPHVVDIKDDDKYEITDIPYSRMTYRMFVLSNRTSTESYLYGMSTKRPRKEYLYYVSKPFCHFVKYTTKTNLYKPFRIMEKRNSDSVPVVSVSFDITKTKVLTFTKYNAIGEKVEVRKIPLFRIYNDSLQMAQRYFFDQINEGFARGPDFLKTELVKYKNLFEDTYFKENYQELIKISPLYFY